MKKVRLPLIWQIAIGLLLGIAIGIYLNHHNENSLWLTEQVFKPAGDIFIKLMKMIVIPIVFTCIVVGVAGNKGSSLGRMGAKTIGYFLVVTTLAVIIGITVANVVKPGAGADMSSMVKTDVSVTAAASGTHGIGQVILSLIPDNIISAMASGSLLPVIFFAVFFGIGVNSLEESKKDTILSLFSAVSESMFRVTNIIMAYSPIAVFGMIAATITNFGAEALIPLIKLILTSYLTAILFVVVVFGIIARSVGVNIFSLMKYYRSELLLAFSSASSTAVLPQIISKSEKFGVDKSVSSFVVPTGYSFNLDGASLFLGLCTLFIAQIYNIDMTFGQQALLVATMVITSKGAAGVPGFMFVVLSATLSSAGIPIEGIAFIAGVYRIIEMPSTAINAMGNMLAPIVIAKWENKFDNVKHKSTLSASPNI